MLAWNKMASLVMLNNMTVHQLYGKTTAETKWTVHMMRKAQRRAVVIKLQPVVASARYRNETNHLIYCMSDIQN